MKAKPVIMMVLGRQRVGKTSFLNATAQYFARRGAEFEIWDGDQQNTTYNMSLFHKNALRPPSMDGEEVREWLEQRFISVVQNRQSAILDIGGGDTALARLVHDVPVAEMLESEGVGVVLVHVVGPETPDLDYLARFTENDLFVSSRTLIVFNGGLVLTGKSPQAAFKQITEHPAILGAIGDGAVSVYMPRLACMSDVTDRGLTFEQALAGERGSGDYPLGMFDIARVRKWWDRELVSMFSAIPAEWLPPVRTDDTSFAAE